MSIRTLANLLDEVSAWLIRKGLTVGGSGALTLTGVLTALTGVFTGNSLEANGWRLVTTEHTLADLSSTAAVAAVFPAGCIPLACAGRVDTPVVTDSAGNAFNVGITSGDEDAFGADVAGADDTAWDHDDWTVLPTTLWSASDQGVTIDPTGAEVFVSGAVRFTVSYLIALPPAVVA